jgi:hypothetical protein
MALTRACVRAFVRAAPIPATRKALAYVGMTIDQIDLYEARRRALLCAERSS